MVFFKQEKTSKFLERFFSNPELAVQSLLFWGEESVGKITTAKFFARGLLCLSSKKTWQGCGSCDSCLMIEKKLHPDLMIVEPEEGSLKIEQARKGIEFLSYCPQISGKRILIIDQAEKMTTAAQNALLKTLEEPPQNCLLILITTSPNMLLPTVRSRLLPLRFPHASQKSIKEFLQENFSQSEKEASVIARRAEGRIGQAIKLIEGDYKKQVQKTENELGMLLKQSFNEQSDYLTLLAKNPDNFQIVLATWLRLLREDVVFHAANVDLSFDQKVQLTSDFLQAAHVFKSSYDNKQLLIENILLNYTPYAN